MLDAILLLFVLATPLVIAHRGASHDAPEHTVAAYDRALAAGADYIEQDLQITRDSVLVVLHDATLDRTVRGPAAACSGKVVAHLLADLAQCDAGSWFNERYPDRARAEFVGARIPTLEQLFQRYGDTTNYYIETKISDDAPAMEHRLVALLARYRLLPSTGAPGRVVLQSFSAQSLQLLHQLAPDVPSVQLLDRRPAGDLDSAFTAIAAYAVGVGPNARLVDSAFVARAHAHCLVVHPYTVDDPQEMRRLIALGVDGLFTNVAGTMRELVGGRRGRFAPRC